jgi:hypothetical protein
LPLLNLALGQVIQRSLPTYVRDDAAEALLAASRIGDMPSRQSAVKLATKILGDQPPEHLQVALAHQKSTLLRIVADWKQSEHVIQELCRRTAGLDHSGDVIQYFYRHLQPCMESKRLNALYGRLHVSHLENLVQSEHYRTAAEEIEDWKISQEPSLMEQCVFRSKTVVVAKLFRCQGRFHDVVHTLEECLKAERNAAYDGASRRDSEDMLPLTSSSEVLAAGFFSDRSRVSHSPSPPQALLVSENLLYNIKVYFENSCRNMILDDHGTLLTPNGAKLHNDLCNDFDSYCFTATMLIKKGLYVEFRRALSKASALVEQILRAEHPRTLACFLEVFIHLIQTGLPEVTSFLRDFIKRMSAKVTRKGHPWGQICWLLSELDSESLD